MAIASIFPAIKPSLNLDFANTKSLDPRITFTRPTGATYYDGKTVAKAEENLFLNSQNFLSTWSVSVSSVSASVSTAPDGTATSYAIAETAVAGSHFVHQSANFVSALAYTVSVFAKKGSGATAPDIVQLTFPSSAFGIGQYANFNIATGVVLTSTGGTAVISSVGSGWYRLSFTATATTTASGNTSCIVFCNNNDTLGRTPNYTGSTTSDVLVWGAQLEQRSQVTAYTPTTTQPITNYVPVLQTAPAGVPRFDHNPVTGESLGLLVEEQRTNLLTWSQDISDASWARSATVSFGPPEKVDLFGAIAGRLLRKIGGTASQSISKAISASAQQYTLTLWVMAGATGSAFDDKFSFGLYQSGSFVPQTSKVISGPGSSSGTTLVSVTGLSKYQVTCVSVTTDSAVSAATLVAYLYPGMVSADAGGFYLIAAQLEVGAFPTSYIKTEASQVTRAADSASMTGTNFSSWYRQDEGSLYVESANYGINAVTVSATALAVHDGTISNRIRFAYAANTRFNVSVNSVDTVSLVSSYTYGTVIKQAAAYKVDDFAFSLAGAVAQKDVSGTVPIVNRLQIGGLLTDREINGYIKKLSYYPKRLTDAQLQALTA